MKTIRTASYPLFVFLVVIALTAQPAGAEVLKIMAANISSGTSQAYESAGIRIFQGLDPDVVLIQEFNYRQGSLRDLVNLAFGTDFEYYVESGGDDIPNGIVSRYPIISSGTWNDTYIDNRDFAWAVIDIPGDIDLQCVSVHLKADSESATRNQEALLLRDLILDNFELDHYIVVGGDLNTATRSEAAVGTFNTFLNATSHIPADQNGNGNTSEPRTKPYDWVMPNSVLDAAHTTLHIGSSSYPQGLVFDSHVYTPLTEVSPVQYADSHVNGMQHMAVMRALEIGVQLSPTPTRSPTPSGPPTATFTPGPSPTPTRTPTTSPRPTYTPTPESTSTAVPTPTPTPTGAPEDPTVEFGLSGSMFHPGEPFLLRFTIRNDEIFRRMAQFIVLDAYGEFFFHPDWSQDVGWSVVDLLSKEVRDLIVLEFEWPGGVGSASGLKFYGAVTTVTDFSLLSNLAAVEFGYTE